MAADGVVVTPESAGWAHCGLRVVELPPGTVRTLETGDDEVAVLPLSGGGLTVEVDGTRFELDGRESVFARVTDWAYAPTGSRLTLTSAAGLRGRPRVSPSDPTARARCRRGP